MQSPSNSEAAHSTICARFHSLPGVKREARKADLELAGQRYREVLKERSQ
jgi:hypothetical protein